MYLSLGRNHEQTDESLQNIFLSTSIEIETIKQIFTLHSPSLLKTYRLTDLAAAQVHRLDQRDISTLINIGDSTHLTRYAVNTLVQQLVLHESLE